MAQSKNSVSPKGYALFANLNEADTKFDNNGVYKITLKVHQSDPKVQDFIEKINTLVNASYDEAVEKLPPKKARELKCQYPYKWEEDEDTGEYTGYVMFNFKRKASGETKAGKAWSLPCIPIYDTKKRQVEPNIGNNSIVKIAYSTYNYHVAAQSMAGITLKLMGVQLIDLVPGGVMTADDLGFDEEEDGYVGGSEDTSEDTADTASYPDDEDDNGGDY